MATMPKVIITGAVLTETCPACEGNGAVYAPRCKCCGETVSEKWLEWTLGEIKDTLPCGHDVYYLSKEYNCPKCGGSGEIEHRLTLEELADALAPLMVERLDVFAHPRGLHVKPQAVQP